MSLILAELERCLSDYRIHSVHLGLTGFRPHRNGGGVTDDCKAYRVYDFLYNRVHFRSHDGRALPQSRQFDLAQARTRISIAQAQVATDFVLLHCQTGKRPVDQHMWPTVRCRIRPRLLRHTGATSEFSQAFHPPRSVFFPLFPTTSYRRRYIADVHQPPTSQPVDFHFFFHRAA